MHDAVVDVAAIGVPSDLTEDDVKVIVTLRQGISLTAPKLCEWLREELPRCMAVRYVEFVDGLPRTQTGKIAKNVLRERWQTETTWDSETSTYLASPPSVDGEALVHPR